MATRESRAMDNTLEMLIDDYGVSAVIESLALYCAVRSASEDSREETERHWRDVGAALLAVAERA